MRNKGFRKVEIFGTGNPSMFPRISIFLVISISRHIAAINNNSNSGSASKNSQHVTHCKINRLLIQLFCAVNGNGNRRRKTHLTIATIAALFLSNYRLPLMLYPAEKAGFCNPTRKSLSLKTPNIQKRPQA